MAAAPPPPAPPAGPGTFVPYAPETPQFAKQAAARQADKLGISPEDAAYGVRPLMGPGGAMPGSVNYQAAVSPPEPQRFTTDERGYRVPVPEAPAQTPDNGQHMFLTGQGQPAAKPQAVPGMGGGAGAGHPGMPSAIEQAAHEGFAGEKRALQEQSNAQRELGDIGARTQQLEARHGEMLADTKERYAQEEQAGADQQQEFANRWANVSKQNADRLAGMAEDPDRVWNSKSTAAKIGFHISSVLGGFLQGYNHLSENPVRAKLNKEIERDVEAQRQNYQHAKEAGHEIDNAYAQNYRALGDHRLATLATHKQNLEAMQDRMASMAKDSGSDAAIANAQIEAAKTRAQIAHIDVQAAQYDAQQAAARAKAAGGGGAGKLSKEGEKLVQEQQGNDEFNAQMDALENHPALDKIGLSTEMFQHLGPRLAPESSSTAQDVNDINMRVLGSASKILKDTEGRISPVVVEQLHKFEVAPGDTKEIATKKIQGARHFVNSMARQMGVNAPKSDQAASPPPTSFQGAGQ